MSTASSPIVSKVWGFCTILKDDGVSYGDYLEQLTYLLFLKMADEQARPPFNRSEVVPHGLDWPSLLDRDGDELEVHYQPIVTLNDEKIVGIEALVRWQHPRHGLLPPGAFLALAEPFVHSR